jgi:hypothetical protein
MCILTIFCKKMIIDTTLLKNSKGPPSWISLKNILLLSETKLLAMLGRIGEALKLYCDVECTVWQSTEWRLSHVAPTGKTK